MGLLLAEGQGVTDAKAKGATPEAGPIEYTFTAGITVLGDGGGTLCVASTRTDPPYPLIVTSAHSVWNGRWSDEGLVPCCEPA